MKQRSFLRVACAAAPLALGAVVSLGCVHSEAPRAGRLNSKIGAKVPTLGSMMRTRPLLDDLDVDELDERWDEHASTYDEPLSTALQIGGDEALELEFRGTPLGNVVSLLGETAGVNIVFDAGLVQPVDASFPSVTVGEALHAVLEQNHMELFEDPPGVYSVRAIDGQGGRLRTFQLGSIRATDAAATATAIVGNQATVVTDAAQNLLFVRGSRDAILAVEQFLASADRLERQVLIEVHILEAAIDEAFELGVTHAIDGTIDDDTFNIVQNLATDNAGAFSAVFDFDGAGVRSAINALQSYVDLELISAPRVMTVSGTEANISVIEEVPYVEATATTATDAGSAVTAIEQIAYKEAGVTLQVTPTIQANGILKVAIDKELSEVVGRFMDIPIVDRRKLQSQFLVADRQTIVLGGLMQDRRADQETGVPLLKDVPFLGRLFRNDVDSTEKRELLVFVTPRVVDPNEAAVLARRYQADYERKRTTSGIDRRGR
ncbi:MAG: secretin N-terminal domain-containing protein [Planctomycetota bacterium]